MSLYRPTKKLSWKPVRRGRIYCAPACGGGCTWKDYQEARKDALALVKRMTTPCWKVRVWENCGWHWCIYRGQGQLSINPSDGGPPYSIMLSNMPFAGDPSFSVSAYRNDPNQLVVLQRRAVRRFLESLDRLVVFLP